MGQWCRTVALIIGSSCMAVSAFAADEVFRAKLVAHKDRYLLVRTSRGDQREVRLSGNVVVVSRQDTATDPERIVRNSTLLLSLNSGEVTTIVVEEVPK
jgi:hypothetical protein